MLLLKCLALNRTYSTFGDRTFAAAGTKVWNSLPPDLRQSGLSCTYYRVTGLNQEWRSGQWNTCVRNKMCIRARLNGRRYMVIVHPLSRRLSAGRALAVIAVIWLVSLMVAAPNLLLADTHTWYFDDSSTRTVCFIDWPHEQGGLMCVSSSCIPSSSSVRSNS